MWRERRLLFQGQKNKKMKRNGWIVHNKIINMHFLIWIRAGWQEWMSFSCFITANHCQFERCFIIHRKGRTISQTQRFKRSTGLYGVGQVNEVQRCTEDSREDVGKFLPVSIHTENWTKVRGLLVHHGVTFLLNKTNALINQGFLNFHS